MKTINYNPDVLSCLANLSNDEVFTPPEVANSMLDMLPRELWSNPDARFLDPACKSGVFLREIAKRLIVGLEHEIPDLQERVDHIFHRQLYAIAITELTSLLSRRSVYCSKDASGKYSVSSFSSSSGNIVYNRTEHTWANGRCSYCGASQSVYDRGDALETHAYQFIHTDNPKDLFNMKFDVIIGNPPYQLDDGGNGASAKPIYHLFVEKAKKLRPRYLVMIIPSRWFAGGKGLDTFRNEMLTDKNIRYIKDFVNAKDCFPSNSVSGGVCFFLWDRDNKGTCDFTTVLNGKESRQIRDLSEFSIFVRYNEAINIIRKVRKAEKRTLAELVLSRNPFGISSFVRGTKEPIGNSLILYSSQGISYIERSDVLINSEYINSYKIMISKVTCEHAGEPDKYGQVRLLSSLKVINPLEVCTDSYLIIGKFETNEEANHLCEYLKTKFARFLLLQSITSINISKDKFQFVPLQDFSEPWTDEKLYKKYNLTKEEIDFIESMIRPME